MLKKPDSFKKKLPKQAKSFKLDKSNPL